MKGKLSKSALWLIILVLIITFAATMANLIERDFGNVKVSIIKIINDQGQTVVAKLFRPVTATAENPAPAILNMHGYQNDKNVQDSISIELAKRGFVVLAPDSLGHGDSGAAGLDLMGWFANPAYVMGNETATTYLITLPFVDAAKIGVTGHSMGGMNAVKLPALFPDNVKAVVQQASSPANVPNILMLQARFDEFVGFRENQLLTNDLPTSETRLAALGLTETANWDTTYGSFADGTARRMAWIQMDHHFLSLTNKAVAETVDWFNEALRNGNGGPTWTDPTKQTFMLKEIFGFVTLLGAMLTMLPLTSLLLKTPFFAPVAQPLPKRYVAKKNYWWLAATINMLIGGILYPLTTQYGGILTKIETWFPWMKMEMANGVAAFFLVNAVVCFVLFLLWFRGAKKKQDVTMYDMGVSFDEEKTKIDWKIIGKTVLVGVILFAFMYILEGFFQWALGQEFRFVWPFMRQFSSANRVGYFAMYFIPSLLFWLVNGGIFLFGQIHQKEYSTPAKTQWMWWLKAVYAMVTGLFLVLCLQYVPWLAGAGPGFELLGLPQFTSMWPLMLLVYIPQFIIFFWFLVWFYRKTGRIYLG
ncbi:MAG: alpha/beta fold hydrolase, partial [Anaerolineaceae bacterium]|nr:alpha/beta fold hydrolase [Anaerolineaceae bacterium]